MKQPLEAIKWVDTDKLKPNHYNPNQVAPPELRLLKTSILEDGWTQPIVVNPDYTIVDGFHRWTVSGDEEIAKMTEGKVPVVILKAKDTNHKMMSTIRHNRARGTHAVLKMADIVEILAKDGLELDEIMRRLEMEDEEVIRLLNRKGIPIQMIKNNEKLGKAWIPKK